MESATSSEQQGIETKKQGCPHGVALLSILAVVWLVLDYCAKRFFDSGEFELGQLIAGPFCGIFQFRLVHNTGGAWGIFSNFTAGLGIFSLVLCVAMIAFYVWQKDQLGVLETIGLGLLISGGIGNAIDRFVQGYVVDFIEFSFFDFPVFNIADIGVTCGIVLLIVGLFISSRHDERG